MRADRRWVSESVNPHKCSRCQQDVAARQAAQISQYRSKQCWATVTGKWLSFYFFISGCLRKSSGDRRMDVSVITMASCWTTSDWQRYEGSILGLDQYNQLQLNRQARDVGMNGVSPFEKEEGGGVVCLEDWIICGLADRQLVCFVLEVLDRKQYLLQQQKNRWHCLTA